MGLLDKTLSVALFFAISCSLRNRPLLGPHGRQKWEKTSAKHFADLTKSLAWMCQEEPLDFSELLQVSMVEEIFCFSAFFFGYFLNKLTCGHLKLIAFVFFQC